jgi:adenylylsulfate kinase
MGLPGSGKTFLAESLQKELDCAWFNADKVRLYANDWEFTEDARLRQARRMRNLADFEKGEGRTVICDFVCPTELTRYIFESDYTIWMDTVDTSKYPDTNKIFEPPMHVNYHVKEWFNDTHLRVADAIRRFKRIKNV